MKAIWIDNWGGPEQLIIKNIDQPKAGPEDVLIKVKAFGLNHAEAYFRQGIWGDVSRVTGIECVGEVEQDLSGTFKKGQPVAAIVGGLGRDRQGSYAEYVSARRTNVFALERSGLSWTELAAIPEVYATAWWCLIENLKLKKGQVILVRGATSALGQAAVNIALDLGCRVIGTSRSESGNSVIKKLGNCETLIDAGEISSAVRERHPGGIDAVLELVGSSTVRDSLKMLKKDGRLCMAGFLGGGGPIEGFNPLMDLPSGVDFNFFGSAFVLGDPDFPIAKIPMQMMVGKAAAGTYTAKPAKVFKFDQIVEAHRLMESGKANGKIVVEV